MDDLERDLDRELKRLPVPVAPETLLPRVLMAVAQAEATPWYSRAWITWPRGLQVASAMLLALVAGGLWWVMPSAPSWVADVAGPLASRTLARVEPAAQWAEQASTLGRVLWEVFVQPIAVYFVALLVATSLMCAVLWTAINRVALGGASPQ